MRAVLGLLALHAALIAVGLTVLRALGLAATGRGRVRMWNLGPALLSGTALVVPILVVLLVFGIPLTLTSAALSCLGCWAAAESLTRRRSRRMTSWVNPYLGVTAESTKMRWLRRTGVLAAGGYTIAASFAFARLPTVWDDARIWSLRGLTLADYHVLQPAIFQNQGESGGHAIYPLFQPVLEALLSEAMGAPQLRLFHTELWLLFLVSLWTAAYLLVPRASPASRKHPLWLAPIALLAFTPAVINNIAMGYADVTGSIMLAVGALSLTVWLERDETGVLALATILLAAAASTKDEDMIAALIVLVVGAVVGVVRRENTRRGRPDWIRLRTFCAALLSFAVIVLPWRIWVAAHHLTDSVEPQLPHALSPAYIFGRTHELHQTLSAMIANVVSEWGWLAAVFLAATIVCITTRTARRAAAFHLGAVATIVMSLLWLYTTTPISLAFLLPTSMDRTVDLFMILAAVLTAYLIERLATAASRSSPP